MTQITDLTKGLAGVPLWSPDGKNIVFDARVDGRADIYTVPAEGGNAKRLTEDPAEDNLPVYSIDGKWIYFSSARLGQRQLFRIPAAGGPAQQMTHGGAEQASPSPDGKWIYYTRVGGNILKVPVDGGEESMVIERRGSRFALWAAASGIYTFQSQLEGKFARTRTLQLYPYGGGKPVNLGIIDKVPDLGSFNISPDEKWAIFSLLDSEVHDITMVENFH